MNKSIIIHRTISPEHILERAQHHYHHEPRIIQFFLVVVLFGILETLLVYLLRVSVHVKMLGDIKSITARFVLILQLGYHTHSASVSQWLGE